MKSPESRHDHEVKARFTAADHGVMVWWADQLGKAPAELVRDCVLERLRQLAVSKRKRTRGSR